MNIYELINEKKMVLLIEEIEMLDSYNSIEYIEDIIYENKIVEEGVDILKKSTTIIKKIANKILEYIKRVKSRLNDFLLKFKKTQKNNNHNDNKEKYTHGEENIFTDEYIYDLYGDKVKVKGFIAQIPDYTNFNHYFNELKNLSEDIVQLSYNPMNIDTEKIKKISNDYDNLKNKYGVHSRKEAGNICGRIFIPDYDYRKKDEQKTEKLLKLFPLNVVHYYDEIKNTNKITDDIDKIIDNIKNEMSKIEKAIKNISKNAEEFLNKSKELNSKMKAETDYMEKNRGRFSSKKSGDEWIKMKDEQSKASSAHTDLTILMNKLARLVTDMDDIASQLIISFHNAKTSCAQVVLKLMTIRKKLQTGNIDPDYDEDI